MANTKRILVPIDEKEHCVRAFDCKYILHEQNILRDPLFWMIELIDVRFAHKTPLTLSLFSYMHANQPPAK